MSKKEHTTNPEERLTGDLYSTLEGTLRDLLKERNHPAFGLLRELYNRAASEPIQKQYERGKHK